MRAAWLTFGSEDQRAMALSGDLKDFGVLQLLSLIQVTGKSGALTLKRQQQSATLYFESGLLTKVRTSAEHEGDGLAVALYRAGRIRKEQYQAVVSQVAPSEHAVALLLVDQGVLTHDAVMEFVRESSLSELYSLITWPEGSFYLEVDAAPPEEDILTPTELGPVLEKAKGLLDEWQFLAARIPDMDKLLAVFSEPKQKVQEVRLTLEEWRLIAALCREQSLNEVGLRLGWSELTSKRVAYRLISAGLAEITEPELSSPLPPPIEFPTQAQVASTPEQLLGERDAGRRGGLGGLFGSRPK